MDLSPLESIDEFYRHLKMEILTKLSSITHTKIFIDRLRIYISEACADDNELHFYGNSNGVSLLVVL